MARRRQVREWERRTEDNVRQNFAPKPVVAWRPNRLDLGLGTNNSMFHKAGTGPFKKAGTGPGVLRAELAAAEPLSGGADGC
jgi:hypothetical protein